MDFLSVDFVKLKTVFCVAASVSYFLLLHLSGNLVSIEVTALRYLVELQIGY